MDDSVPLLSEIEESELSTEDLAVLQMFEDMDNWPDPSLKEDTSLFSEDSIIAPVLPFTSLNEEEIFQSFIAEAEEDVARMVHILKDIEQDNTPNPALFMHMQHLGHKLRGTAGAVDFPLLSTIASQVEVIAEQVSEGKISYFAGLSALSKAIAAIEGHLHKIASQGKEFTR